MSIDSLPATASTSVPRPTADSRAAQSSRDTGTTGPVTSTARNVPTPREEAASANQIAKALDEVRNALAPVAQNLLFSVDEDTGRTIIKVVDKATDEVIKQIPSEEIIAIAKAVDRLQGLLVKQQA